MAGLRPRLHQHLSLRIWLAVLAAIVVMTLLLGWMWRLQWEHDRAERHGREVVVLDDDGEVLGRAPARISRGAQGLEFRVPLDNGQTLKLLIPRPPRPPGGRSGDWLLPFQSLWAFVALLVAVALAVAAGAYPFVRRLTQRLEVLQKGVERWGEGDLSTRLPVQGQDEVAFLAQRFNAAADRVQGLLVAHKSLLANASHELRSPLARIRMGLTLMENGGNAGQRAEIERNINELDELIDEILLASRLDLADAQDPAAMGPLEEVDLLGLAAEECARSGAELEVEAGLVPPLLQGQGKLLRRLIRNLLENAKRHGGRDGQPAEVTLTLRAAVSPMPEAQAGWALVVGDRGPGVPPMLRERIFEPFFRLPGASEREGGVGLGLALVRAIALRHGGRVRCEDRPGGGAQFVVWLPKI